MCVLSEDSHNEHDAHGLGGAHVHQVTDLVCPVNRGAAVGDHYSPAARERLTDHAHIVPAEWGAANGVGSARPYNSPIRSAR